MVTIPIFEYAIYMVALATYNMVCDFLCITRTSVSKGHSVGCRAKEEAISRCVLQLYKQPGICEQ